MTELYSWIKPEYLAAFILVVARMSGLFMIAPLLSNKAVPARVRIALVVTTTLLLFPMVVKQGVHFDFKSDLILITLIIRELTVGLIIGFSAFLVFAGVQMGGELLGMQLGLGIASIFDPANEGSASIVTTLYVVIGALMFLYLDGHHLMLLGLIRSFDMSPIGSGIRFEGSMEMVKYFSSIFATAIQMAIPLMIVATLLNVVFGLLTKLSPQMNIYFNSAFIITPAIGIVVMITTMPLFRVLLTKMTEGLEPQMILILRQMKGI